MQCICISVERDSSGKSFYVKFWCSRVNNLICELFLRPTAHWHNTMRRDELSTPCIKKIAPVEWMTRILMKRDATHMYMIKIVHRQLVIQKVSAKIQHESLLALHCYEEFGMEYCQLVSDVAYLSIIIYVTICYYIVIRFIINSALEYLDSA